MSKKHRTNNSKPNQSTSWSRVSQDGVPVQYTPVEALYTNINDVRRELEEKIQSSEDRSDARIDRLSGNWKWLIGIAIPVLLGCIGAVWTMYVKSSETQVRQDQIIQNMQRKIDSVMVVLNDNNVANNQQK